MNKMNLIKILMLAENNLMLMKALSQVAKCHSVLL